ncbi:MAG: hypothetical protein GXY24_07115 [Bacteroidales bacterium]|jgi:hypothetical protein|nr:hypothetical protein [Bacteroidales bacterium]
MKKIFRYFVLSLALTGAFTACDILNPVIEPADIGLGIKVFSPTKVVTGQPMTINGSGFADATEIVFPDGVTVTDFEIVSNDMIRVTAPAGIAAAGGKIIVRTAEDQVESPLALTLGKTVVSGYSKQPGEEIQGGEQITIYGTDLEFINSVELLDADGNPIILSDAMFYRKGTSSVVITVPKKVYEGTFTGKLSTYDGQEILLPELKYKPAAEGGHWETQKTVIWENNTDMGTVDWGNVNYRIAGEGHETGEEVTIIAADIWEKMKTTPFYMSYTAGDSYQIRVITGWWGTQWLGKDNDIAPWNMPERIIDNGDGTFAIKVDFSEDPAILETIDAQHLLFTGAGYTPVEIYFAEEVWVGGGGTPSEYDIAAFTMYEDRSANLTYPYFPSWSDNSGKLRIMRGGDPAIEEMGLTTSSKFVVYKKVGTTGQLQWNDPSWGTFAGVECNDWDGSAETLEVAITEDMLKWINGESTDGWSDTAIILQGDGLEISKIVIVP